jgi:bifunctional UDP-N-acetylglucosamine pyrophosphorylase/glucosamine-1-phosphate N-acetyltransferase
MSPVEPFAFGIHDFTVLHNTVNADWLLHKDLLPYHHRQCIVVQEYCCKEKNLKRQPHLTEIDIWLYLIVARSKMPILHDKLSTIILAAGEGKRMKSKTPKILHPILGKPLISFVLELAGEIGSAETVLVVNNTSDGAYDRLGDDIQYAIQEKPLGSGDAARQGLEKAHLEIALILCGDVPLLKKQTLSRLCDYHTQQGADLTILTCRMDDPFGYGRIVRDPNDYITAIIEQTDADPQQQKIKEINAGVYLGSRELLLSALGRITNENEQGEYYLTDAIREIASAGNKVCGYITGSPTEIIGVNSKAQLARVRELVKQEWFSLLMKQGVFIEDPATTNIDLSVKIGRSVHIRPHTMIEGETVINDGETVGPFVWIKDGKKITQPNG